jgi:hypothetical protein
VRWNSVVGVDYFIQVTSYGGATGAFTLQVDGTDEPLVEYPGTCALSIHSTCLDMKNEILITPLSSLPATVCTSPKRTCTSTEYWVYNTTTDTPILELTNNSVTCIAQPYNIEVRPCGVQPSLPVSISLSNDGTNKVITDRLEIAAPFFVWGDNTTTGDVFPSKVSLRNGVFSLLSSVGGRIRFTQSCP